MHLRPLWMSALLLAPTLGVGCGGPPAKPPAQEPIETTPPPEVALPITVQGTVEVYPPAQAWLDARGEQAPALEGLRVRVEEPLFGVLSDQRASFGEVTLGADAAFRVADVPTGELALGLAGAVEDPAAEEGAQGRVVPTSTVLYDTTREGQRPKVDVREARAFALPPAWLDALSAAVGAPAIATIAPGLTHLGEAGYVLGQVVDAAGAPVAGARVVVSPEDLAPRVFYPAADLSSAHQQGTSESGLFMLVHDGGDVRTFTLTVDGRTDIPRHSGTAARGAGLVLTVFPASP